MTELRPIAVESLHAGIACCVCSFFILLLKYFSRYHHKSAFGMDDVLVAFAWITTVLIAISFQIQGENGMGYSMSEIPYDVYLVGRQWAWVSSWVYYLGLGLSKLSVTMQFLRIFITPKTKLVTKGAICFVTCWTVIAVCVAAFECAPIARYWDKTIPGKCINGKATFLAMSCMNIMTDIVIIGIPIPSLLKLQVGAAKKLGLIFAFSLGLVVCSISIARIPMVLIAMRTPGKPGGQSLAMWSTIELNVAIICACLPSIRPLFASFLRFAGLDSYLKDLTPTRGPKSSARAYAGGTQQHGGSAMVSAVRHERRGRGGSRVEYIEMEDGLKGDRIKVRRDVEVKSEIYTHGEESTPSEGGRESRKSDEDSIDRLVSMPDRTHRTAWG